MPLAEVTKPKIEVPLTEEGDVVLRVVSIPAHVPPDIYNAMAAGKRVAAGEEPQAGLVPALPTGTIGRIILDECLWEVEGPIVDSAGEAIDDPARRRAAARRAVTQQSDAFVALVMDTLAFLDVVPGNWRMVSTGNQSGPGTPSE